MELFGLNDLLKRSGGRKNEFDGAKGRGVLPLDIYARYETDDDKARATFTLRHAAEFKAFVDLTRFGQKAADVAGLIYNGLIHITAGQSTFSDDHRVELVPARDPMTWAGDDLFLCREAYTADFVKAFPENTDGFSVKSWGGTKDEIAMLIAFENAANAGDNRETIALQFYNFSKAVRFVKDMDARLAKAKKNTKGEEA